MAVSPYVSRAELWLANSSFRPTFHLPNDFHPSVFLKWFPGHMAKGLSLSAVEIIFDNTEETMSIMRTHSLLIYLFQPYV